MQVISNRRETSGAIRNELGAIFVSMELSRSTWLITSLSPGGGEKMSRHTLLPGTSARCWRVFRNSGRRR
jgi:transposase